MKRDEPWCHGCGLALASVCVRADGITRCDDCQWAVEPKPAPSPLATAVETARASARNAELDLRQALNAASGDSDGLAWLLLYDLIEPATKLADRIADIGQRCGKGVAK